ncbi:MAG: hypothetical protein RLZZ444_1231 [Pseudomonadota bacterium]|jgi:hypothetical protein
MPKVQKTVQYRYLNRPNSGLSRETLEQVIRDALAEKRGEDVIGQKARARIADLNQSGQLTLWNGIQGSDGGFIGGELVLYKDGFDLPAIEEKLDAEENRFDLVRFQTDGKSKPVEGTLYFAVIGDHLGIIQSNAVTGRWLERYLTWLLKDIANRLEPECFISLDAHVILPNEELGKMGPARSLSVHASTEASSLDIASEEPSRSFRAKRKGKGAKVIQVLELLGLGEDVIESIASDVPPGGSLEGDFLVYIKVGNKRREISVGTLNHALRNIEPGDVSIERKGSRRRDNAETFSEPVRVTEAQIGLDPNDAIERIIDVLYRWGKQGVIDLGTA